MELGTIDLTVAALSASSGARAWTASCLSALGVPIFQRKQARGLERGKGKRQELSARIRDDSPLKTGMPGASVLPGLDHLLTTGSTKLDG